MFQLIFWGFVCFCFITLLTVNWGCFFGSHDYVFVRKYTIITRSGTTTRRVYRCSVCGKDKPIRAEDFSYTYN